MQVHAVMVIACYAPEEGHAVFGCSKTGAHDLAPPSRGSRAVDSGNGPRCVLATVVRDVEADDRRSTAGGSPFDQQDFRDFTVLAKVLVGTQSRDELQQK